MPLKLEPMSVADIQYLIFDTISMKSKFVKEEIVRGNDKDFAFDWSSNFIQFILYI